MVALPTFPAGPAPGEQAGGVAVGLDGGVHRQPDRHQQVDQRARLGAGIGLLGGETSSVCFL